MQTADMDMGHLLMTGGNGGLKVSKSQDVIIIFKRSTNEYFMSALNMCQQQLLLKISSSPCRPFSHVMELTCISLCFVLSLSLQKGLNGAIFWPVSLLWNSFIVSDGPLVNSYLFLYVVGLFNNITFIDESFFCKCSSNMLIFSSTVLFLVAHTVCLVHKLPLHVFYGAGLELSKFNLFIQGFNHLSVVLCSHTLFVLSFTLFSIFIRPF